MESTFGVEYGGAGLKFDARDPVALVDKKCLGPETVDDLDISLQCLLDFMLPGRHLLAFFQTNQGDFLGTFAFGCQGDIDGDITAANDDDIVADGNIFAHGGITQKINPL